MSSLTYLQAMLIITLHKMLISVKAVRSLTTRSRLVYQLNMGASNCLSSNYVQFPDNLRSKRDKLISFNVESFMAQKP
jgi:hypothetical protein